MLSKALKGAGDELSRETIHASRVPMAVVCGFCGENVATDEALFMGSPTPICDRCKEEGMVWSDWFEHGMCELHEHRRVEKK